MNMFLSSSFRWIVMVVVLSFHHIQSRRIIPSNILKNTTLFPSAPSVEPRRLTHHNSNTLNDRLVTSLPKLQKYSYRHWSGYVDVEKGRGHLFYWLFEAWKDPSTAPLIVWLNGGPGCSSMDGLFLENGPFRLDNDLSIKVNPHSWVATANVLYIDQPVGTGLSYTKGSYPRNDGDVNRALLEFFDGFFQIHKDLIGREFYLTGESHAGHYLPSFAKAIMLRAEKQGGHQKSFEAIKLGGLAIGNGWFDPRNQYDVSSFAHGAGLISNAQARELKQKEKTCQKKLDGGTYMSTLCWDLLDDVVKQSGPNGKPKVLMYDIRKYAKSSASFPPGHLLVEKYLNLKEVRTAIHATQCPLQYKECTDPPYNALKHQDGLGVTQDIVYLLNKGVRMLFFNGQYDMICNHVGVETSLEALQWQGIKDFALAVPAVWIVGNNPAGYIRTFGPLSLLLVLDSGHMVPMDKPAEALDMISRFVKHKSLADSKGGVKTRGALSVEKEDLSILPPIIQEDPIPGDKMVAVSFEHSREAPRRSSGSESLNGHYVVTSSPEGISASGSRSPIIVKGLTNGVPYTFNVVSEVRDAATLRRSAPSAGSSAVIPGCGAALSDDMLAESQLSHRSLLIGRGNEEESSGFVEESESLELSLTKSPQHKIGCVKGVCAKDGSNADKCLCFTGYTGNHCDMAV